MKKIVSILFLVMMLFGVNAYAMTDSLDTSNDTRITDPVTGLLYGSLNSDLMQYNGNDPGITMDGAININTENEFELCVREDRLDYVRAESQNSSDVKFEVALDVTSCEEFYVSIIDEEGTSTVLFSGTLAQGENLIKAIVSDGTVTMIVNGTEERNALCAGIPQFYLGGTNSSLEITALSYSGDGTPVPPGDTEEPGDTGDSDDTQSNNIISIYADYNKKKVTIDGLTMDAFQNVTVVVTAPGKGLDESVLTDTLVYAGQTKSDADGMYSVEFILKEGYIGDYKYLTRIGDEAEEYTFSFKDMAIEKNGEVVKSISEVTSGDTIRLTLNGYDSNYDGNAVIAQYDGFDKLVDVKFEPVKGGAVNFADEDYIETTVKENVNIIKAFYWNRLTYKPFTGAYVVE